MKELHSARTYRLAIQKLVAKYRGTTDFFRIDRDGNSLWAISVSERKTASHIASEISERRFHFSPQAATRVRISGKTRVLFRLTWKDRIVHAAFGDCLTQLLEPSYPTRLYSYRKGLGSERAVSDLVGFVRKHRRTETNLKKRGLFCELIDISEYGESIPAGSDSPLWKILEHELSTLVSSPDLTGWLYWIKAAIDPALRVFNFEPESNRVKTGLPTGSALVPILNNVFLMDLDRELAKTAPGNDFWSARYGDDLIVTTPSHDLLSRARALIEKRLLEKNLSVSLKKRRVFFWSGSGAGFGAIPGSQWIEYLGSRISFSGQRFFKREKIRELKRLVRQRLKTALSLAKTRDYDSAKTLRAVLLAAHHAVNPLHPFSLPGVERFYRVTVDRRLVRQFRDWLWLRAVSVASGGRQTRKVFRKTPPRKLIGIGAPRISQ